MGDQGGETRPERAWLCGESIHMSGPGTIFVVPGTGSLSPVPSIFVVSSAPVRTPKCSKALTSTRTPSFHRRAVCPLLVDCTSAQLVVQTVKNAPAHVGDLGSSLGGEDSPGEGMGRSLWYSCLENPTNRGAWRATAHGVAESETTEQRTLSLFFPALLSARRW